MACMAFEYFNAFLMQRNVSELRGTCSRASRAVLNSYFFEYLSSIIKYKLTNIYSENWTDYPPIKNALKPFTCLFLRNMR